MKMSMDDKEVITDWLHTDSAKVVRGALAALAADIDADVMKCASSESQRLVILRAQGEGARRLVSVWEQFLQSLKGNVDGSGKANGKSLR